MKPLLSTSKEFHPQENRKLKKLQVHYYWWSLSIINFNAIAGYDLFSRFILLDLFSQHVLLNYFNQFAACFL